MGLMRVKLTPEDFHELLRRYACTADSELVAGQPAASRPSPRLADGPIMKLSQAVYLKIMREVAYDGKEHGGVLIGPTDEYCVTHFLFDDTGHCTAGSWTFGHARLNEILKQYVPLGLDCKGYVHSHPPGFRRLSAGDMVIPQKAFANPKNCDLYEVWMPVIVDRAFCPFVVFRDRADHAEPAQLVLI